MACTLIDICSVACVVAADDGQTYYPLFFTHDHAFEEFYCTCIQLLNKTWKEMKATSADFNKASQSNGKYQSFSHFRLVYMEAAISMRKQRTISHLVIWIGLYNSGQKASLLRQRASRWWLSIF